MDKYKDVIINTCFSFFFIIMVVFYRFNIIKNFTDKFLGFLAIICSSIVLFAKTNFLLDLGHFIYTIPYLCGVTFFSYNKYLLLLNVIMLFNIIFTRYYYDECILNDKQNNKGFFTDISGYLNINWDYVYPILICVSFVKLLH
jgi:hypothetical protein